ncbi:GNAT family N-acetyltransferase [bacterium]|jgi:GNAT superfamily N-acetyltransferase|nr:GNAT family N-acetyltransferase [bacterium]
MNLQKVDSQRDLLDWTLEQERELFSDGALNSWSLVPLAQTQILILGFKKGVPVGYALLLQDRGKPDFLYLFSFGIQKHLQGQGLGAELGEDLRAWTLKNGYSGWTLTVSQDNLGARVLYKNLGKVEEETLLQAHYGKGEDRLWWKLSFVA